MSRFVIREKPCTVCSCWHGEEVCPTLLFPLDVADLPVLCCRTATSNRAVAFFDAAAREADVRAPTNRDTASARHKLGPMNIRCPHCNARFWPNEKINCCYGGTLILPEPTVPAELQSVIFSRSVRDHIRQYNMAMSMVSVGHSNASLVGGTFVMAGKSYHRIGPMTPQNGEASSFAQIYLLDAEEATNRRQQIFRHNLDNHHLRQLHELMLRFNPRIAEFRRAASSSVQEFTWSTDCDILGMQMGALVVAPGQRRHIIVRRSLDDKLASVSDAHPLYHPLAYPLLFPTGASGWHAFLQRVDMSTLTSHKVTLPDYGRSLLMHRETPTHIQKCGRLAIEYYCDMWAQHEAHMARFHTLPSQQAKYRVGRKCAIEDQLSREGDIHDASTPMTLPSSFVGSNKWYHMLYLDALTFPVKFHAPDLFITFTCNNKWDEIVNALPRGSCWQDHPDIVARCFWLKLKALMDDICKHEIFGKVVAFVWRIEWQARGLPHAHILIILESPIITPQQIDAVVSAEIPDPDAHAELFCLVTEKMLHDPCDHNAEAGCRKDQKGGLCKRHFPKDTSARTAILPNKFPKYRRRCHHTAVVKGRIVSDDWVVPYSPFLLLKYGAHCNVECAAHIKTFKYVYKYVMKAPDSAVVCVNEIEAFLSGRLLSASEAVWRFLGLPLHKEFPPVMRLDIHLPNEQAVVFGVDDDNEDIGAAATKSTSTLLEWFALNQRDDTARSLLYTEVPEHFTWNSQEKLWTRRKIGNITIARIYSVSSRNQELFALRRLLNIVKGAQSWNDLLQFDGYNYNSFLQVCEARGMMHDNSDVIAAFQNMVDFCCSLQNLRREFAIILLNRNCPNAQEFFNHFASHLCANGIVNPSSIAEALWEIEHVMTEHGRSLQDHDYGFRLPNMPAAVASGLQHALNEHVFDTAECTLNSEQFVQKFSAEQRSVMDAVLEAVEGRSPHNVHAVLASAGSGKSLLVAGITWYLRAHSKIVLNVAASALAATMLPSGRTAHSAFRIPVPTNSSSFCGLKSHERELLRLSSVIFYDEVSMVSKDVANALDRACRDVTNVHGLPFGGKVVVFLGDFKQLLPVAPGIRRAPTVKNCEWWPHVRIFSLTKNYRAAQNPSFALLLEQIGNGLVEEVTVPESSRLQTVQELITRVHGHDMTAVPRFNNMILSPRLETCRQINEMCLNALPDNGVHASAFDDLKDRRNADLYTDEYIASLQLSGVPPATLLLKKHGRYMITKNYDIKRGVVNGTLIEMLHYSRHMVQVQLLTGTQKGRVIQLPRCSSHVSTENSGLPFAFERVQFPVIPAYCVSVHKSQGQSLDIVGLWIDQDCFAHGQL